MTGIDTNVLVRYLTRDDPDQYRAAKTFLESSCTQEDPGYVGEIVLCEVVWVLTGAYDATKGEVVDVIDQLLRTRQLQIGHRDSVREALEAYRRSDADFADCLLGALNEAAGCEETVTFDRNAGELDGWNRLAS
jgi:predicted nucleic-acid-binding protein